MYELTLSDQAQVTLQLRGSLSDLRYGFFYQPALAGTAERNLSPGLETAVGGPEAHFYVPLKLPHGLYQGDMNTIKCKI